MLGSFKVIFSVVWQLHTQCKTSIKTSKNVLFLLQTFMFAKLRIFNSKQTFTLAHHFSRDVLIALTLLVEFCVTFFRRSNSRVHIDCHLFMKHLPTVQKLWFQRSIFSSTRYLRAQFHFHWLIGTIYKWTELFISWLYARRRQRAIH